jgi:ferredoxin-NADP reductase
MDHIVKINSVHPVTHDVNRYRFNKPEGFQFTPGQAADVSINLPEWKDEKRPFTFTCLNSDPYLEFTIKSYPNNGVTQQLPNLKPGNELIISDPWGAIEYKGEGYFIAGGAGITPFIAILRQLFKDAKIKGNKLFFSNKTSKDIIYENELKTMLGEDAIFVVTKEKDSRYVNEYINESFLNSRIKDFSKYFYICGPDPMVQGLTEMVTKKGARPETVVFEK